MTRMTRWAMTTVLAAVLAASVAGMATGQDQPKALYDRLGGVYSIATVVDDFIERLLVNDTLNANPAVNQARAHVPKAGLKFQVTALVCEVTGGPCKYTGKSMKESHAGMGVGDMHFTALVENLVKSLDKFKVGKTEKDQLLGVLGPMKADIVEAKPAAKKM